MHQYKVAARLGLTDGLYLKVCQLCEVLGIMHTQSHVHLRAN